MPSPALSFRHWCGLQQDEGEKLNPAAVLPFKLPAPDFDYWHVRPEELYFRDSSLIPPLLTSKQLHCFLAPVMMRFEQRSWMSSWGHSSSPLLRSFQIVVHLRYPLKGMDESPSLE
ncbi:hypothetical protein BDV19DRAFT_49386 [Aspergillus venezuelensis]